ncbi:hypothetical protein KC367_g247 [Hortaea werneckii]|nr:hypothetical protein KC367_g247 [Hortaea werneckii]
MAFPRCGLRSRLHLALLATCLGIAVVIVCGVIVVSDSVLIRCLRFLDEQIAHRQSSDDRNSQVQDPIHLRQYQHLCKTWRDRVSHHLTSSFLAPPAPTGSYPEMSGTEKQYSPAVSVRSRGPCAQRKTARTRRCCTVCTHDRDPYDLHDLLAETRKLSRSSRSQMSARRWRGRSGLPLVAERRVEPHIGVRYVASAHRGHAAQNALNQNRHLLRLRGNHCFAGHYHLRNRRPPEACAWPPLSPCQSHTSRTQAYYRVCTSTGNCRPSACTIGGAPSLNRRGFSAKSLTRSFRTQTDNARKHSDEDVGIHASFMRFIEDDGGVLRQNEVLTDLTEQDAVGHELDGRITVDIGIVADLMCDPALVRHAQLGRNALCNGYRSDTPRLSDSYHAFTLHSSRFIRRLLANMRTIPTLEHHLWNLSGLA